jgi:thiamine biosynthesis lipoprotein
MQKLELDALGTHWWIEWDKSNTDIKKDIKQLIDNFESKYSRFSKDSLLYKLNDAKKIINPSKELVDLINYGIKFNKISNGVLNISVGGELSKKGYGVTSKKDIKIIQNLDKTIKIKDNEIEIPGNMALDIGCYGKGWLIGKIASFLDQKKIINYFINGGGDIYVNLTTPIKIYLEHPISLGQAIGYALVDKGSIASSSAIKRSWSFDNKQYHHLINPNNNQSYQTATGIFIKAKNALLADTFSTLFMLIDNGERKKYAEKYKFDYLVVENDRYYQSKNFKAAMN